MLMFRRNVIFNFITMTLIWEVATESEYPKDIISVKAIKNFTLTIPEHCEDLGICEDIPNYPYKEVSAIIGSLSTLNITLNMDSKKKAWTENSEEEEVHLCTSSLKIYYPQAARNVNKEWNLILNLEETPQNFFGKQCEKECVSCGLVSIPNYNMICSQKRMGRTMYGLNRELNQVIKTIYEVPSCCACVGKRRNI